MTTAFSPTALLRYFEVQPPVSVADLRHSYRKLAQRHHPDKGGSKEAFQQLQSNYQAALLLCDSDKPTLFSCSEEEFARACEASVEKFWQHYQTWQQQQNREAEKKAREWARYIDESIERWCAEEDYYQDFKSTLVHDLGLENPVAIEYVEALLIAKRYKYPPQYAWKQVIEKYGDKLARVLLPWSVAQELRGHIFDWAES